MTLGPIVENNLPPCLSRLTLLHNFMELSRHNNQPTPILYDTTLALKLR